mmetsp:Transcript_107388/g.312174  ORF Transcript_107388/g.312174 Transcript_107388/m.312174 type:complete len:110 (-) Transcript_107388:1505-1834(-)
MRSSTSPQTQGAAAIDQMMVAGMTPAERRYAAQSASMDHSERMRSARALEYKSSPVDPLHQNTSSYRSRGNDTDFSAEGGSSFYEEFMAGDGGGRGDYSGDDGGDCAQS